MLSNKTFHKIRCAIEENHEIKLEKGKRNKRDTENIRIRERGEEKGWEAEREKEGETSRELNTWVEKRGDERCTSQC